MSENKYDYKFLKLISTKQLTKGFAVTYIPIFLISINTLWIRDPVVGIVSTTAFLLFNGYVVYEKLKFLLGEIKWVGIGIGGFIFLTGLCIISSFFVIFSKFPSEYVITTVILSGIPMVFLRIQNDLPIIPISFPKFGITKWHDPVLIAIWIIFLVSDALTLSSDTTTDSSTVWVHVPKLHVYLLFLFLFTTGIILFRNFNIFARSLIIILSIIFVFAYPFFVVPTLFSNDTWFMLGEVNHALQPFSSSQPTDLLNENGHKISIGFISISEKLVTGWARGIPNSLALYSSQLFSINTLEFWRLLGPVFAGGTTALILFRLGNLISKNYLFSLFTAISISFYSSLVYYMANTIKLSLSMPFFVLGVLFWLHYLLKRDKKSLIFSFVITALNFLNYSLYFLILIDMMILSILIHYISKKKSVASNKIKFLLIPTFVGLLSLLIPSTETLLGSSFTTLPLSNHLDRFYHWLVVLSGYSGSNVASIPYGEFILTQSWFFLFGIIKLILFGIGLVRFNFNKEIRNVLFLLVVTLNISAYVSLNLMTYPHALGGYLVTVMHIAEIPFVAFGLFWLFSAAMNLNFSMKKSFVKTHTNKKFVVPVVCMLMAMLVVSAQIVETGSAWLGYSDVLANKKIIKDQENNKDYSLISQAWGSYPLYYFTGGEKLNGNFKADIVPFVKHDDRAEYYFKKMMASPSKSLLLEASNETKSCTVYLLKPSFIPVNPAQLRNISSIMGLPTIFYNNNQKSFLFEKSICSPTQPISLSNEEVGKALTELVLYDDALKKYDQILQVDKTNIDALIGKAEIYEKLNRYNDTIQIYIKLLEMNVKKSQIIENYVKMVSDTNVPEDLNNKILTLTSKTELLNVLIPRAEYFALSGEFDTLLRLSNNMVSIDDSNVTAWSFKVIALANLGDYKNVTAAFYTLKQKTDLETKSLMDKASISEEHDTNVAIMAYSKIIEINENMIKSELHYAKFFVDSGLTDKAYEIYNNIWKLYQDNVDIWNKMNKIYDKQLRLDLIVARNLGIIQFDKSDILYALNEQTSSFLNANQYSGALLSNNVILLIVPQNVNALHNNALALMKLERYDDALATNDKILSIDPSNIEALNNKAVVFIKQERYDDALATNDKILSIDPSNIETFNTKAAISLILGNYNNALSLYDKILLIVPQNVNVLHNKALALMKLERYDDALATNDKILSIDPSNIEAMNLKMGLLIMRQNYDDALSISDEALSIDPNNIGILKLKSLVLIQKQRYSDLVPILDKILSMNSTDTDVLHNKALALMKLERYDDALATNDKILSIDPSNIEALELKAEILINLNRLNDAVSIYNKILSIDPTNSYALDMKNKILAKIGS